MDSSNDGRIGGGWEIRMTENTVMDQHVVPVGDLMDHIPDDCPCGTDEEHLVTDDGIDFWVVTHHALDGRELKEARDGQQ